MDYIYWLAFFSVVVAVFEKLWPARDQKQLRTWLWSDFIHLAFNGHFFGLILYGLSFYHVLPLVDGFLSERGWSENLYFSAASGWGIVLQSVVALVVLDFVQWCVHNTLHRYNFLWRIHQVHHSVKQGEMDWIVSFRFSWIEPVIYKAVMYIPAMWFGFAPEALFFHAVFGTLVGHLNHANVTWDYGILRYVFNSPRMHLYHHAYDAPASGQNFGITLSCWDWIFGTSHLPDEPCPKIGFPGVELLPNDFFGQIIWPIPLKIPSLQKTNVFASVGGLAVLGGLYAASLPPTVETPMFGEVAASSQPVASDSSVDIHHAETSWDQEAAIARFGNAASGAGWAQASSAVSAVELAEALGSEDVVILDIRKADRFESGHIPSSQLVTRGDYSGGDIPGVSFEADALQEMLRVRGVNQDSTVVLLGDGGPEPYRLWWTLSQVAGFETRVLDGGLDGWKAIGELLAEGTGVVAQYGDVELSEGIGRNLMWADVAAVQESYPELQFLDTRDEWEYNGTPAPEDSKHAGLAHHPKSERAGRIPGAEHARWTDVFEINDTGVPVLRSPEDVLAQVRAANIDPSAPLVTYCQSGTRSAAIFYGLVQAGVSTDTLWNYDGSWAEYSRLSLDPEGAVESDGAADVDDSEAI